MRKSNGIITRFARTDAFLTADQWFVYFGGNGRTYFVLFLRCGAHCPEKVPHNLDKPVVTVHAREVDSYGTMALSVDSVGG